MKTAIASRLKFRPGHGYRNICIWPDDALTAKLSMNLPGRTGILELPFELDTAGCKLRCLSEIFVLFFCHAIDCHGY